MLIDEDLVLAAGRVWTSSFVPSPSQSVGREGTEVQMFTTEDLFRAAGRVWPSSFVPSPSQSAGREGSKAQMFPDEDLFLLVFWWQNGCGPPVLCECLRVWGPGLGVTGYVSGFGPPPWPPSGSERVGVPACDDGCLWWIFFAVQFSLVFCGRLL